MCVWKISVLLLVSSLFHGTHAQTSPMEQLEGYFWNSIANILDTAWKTLAIFANPVRILRGLDPLTHTPYANPEVKNDEVFDFIIVGGGSAGAVLANRLSEIKLWNVLLLEAGGDPMAFMEVPALPAIWQYSEYNWNFFMEKQPNMSQGLTDQVISAPRGKGLGGSSLINYMMNVRGNRRDYDKWGSLGNPGWSFADVLPYFKKLEGSKVKNEDKEYRGTKGNVGTEDRDYRSKIVDEYINAGRELGYKYLDYNGKEQIGVSYIQATTRDGLRCSTEKAYLRPARNRKNLKILTYARVTKVLISNKVAFGVEYQLNGVIRRARASKEVILSAGVFQSPQILMLSGVGPREHLEDMNIPTVVDLPVGKLLHDHLFFVGMQFTIEKPYSLQLADWINPVSIVDFATKGTGPLTTLSAVEAIGFINTNLSISPPQLPDIEFMFLGGGFHTDLGQLFRKPFRVSDESYKAIWGPLTGKHGWTIMPLLLHPKSHGRVELRSNNPLDTPKIIGNYFTDKEGYDMKTMITAIREIQRFAATDVMRRVGTKLVSTPLPACRTILFDTDQYWECAIRALCTTLHHLTHTCKMGPKNDPTAVVDARLRVYGIKNLRVADASIFPVTISGHMNVPAIMVGEKASDIIKEDYRVKWLG